jgi:hypothetical protein
VDGRRETAYRIICPLCGGWAQLRIADPFGRVQTEPVIVMFACVNEMDDGHGRPTHNQLRALLPGRRD